MKRFALFLCIAVAAVPLSAQAPLWQAAAGGKVPEYATAVGRSADGAVLYLARAAVADTTAIGWLDQRTTEATIVTAEGSTRQASFQLYTGGGRWVAASDGRIPPGAVSAGLDAAGLAVPIVRVSSQGWIVPALFSPQDGTATAVIDRRALRFSSYEVLVPDWLPVGDPGALNQALRAGKDGDGTDLVPFRAPQGTGLHPGKLRLASSQGYVPYGGGEVTVVRGAGEVFVGTGLWRAVTGRVGNGAIPAGSDDDGTPLYMARAPQGGGVALGKYNPRTGEASVPYGGRELRVSAFEVLYYDLSGVPPSQVAAPPPARNWLANPGAETQPVTSASWRQVSGDWSKLKSGTDARSGAAFFWGGQSARAELAQDVSVADFAARLADGRAIASFRGYLSSWKDDADSSAVTLEAVDRGGAVLASTTTGARNFDVWTLESLALTLPAATARVRVRLVATRAAGSDNNGYFDDLELLLSGSDGRPLDAPAAALPRPPAVLADRPAAPVEIRTYYGLYGVEGRLETSDGVRNGKYTDTYRYQAAAGEELAIAAWPHNQLAVEVSVLAPGGQVIPAGRFVAAQAGTYTINISAKDPASLADGGYWLSLEGVGRAVSGKLDPFEDRRDAGRIYDSVDFTAERAGIYAVAVVTRGFRDPRLVVKDKDYREVTTSRSSASGARDGTQVDTLEAVRWLDRGAYHLVVEDELIGGAWNLEIRYLGEGGA